MWAIGGLAGALLLVRFILGSIRHFVKVIEDETIRALVWRHFTGAHYHGERRTDASWFSYGSTTSRKYDTDGFMSRWEHKPRAHRAAWRIGVTLAVIGLVYGMFADTTVTLNALKAFGVYGLFVAGFVIEARWRLRLHTRHVLNPTVKSLASYMRLSPHAVRRMLHIRPEDIKEDGEIGYLELPPEVTPGDDQRTTISRIIDAHLPVDTEVDWRLNQSPKLGIIQANRKPPEMVLWEETVDAMERAAYGDIVIGKDRYKNIYTANFINLDDPHWAFSVNTKRGKSNFLGLVAVQVLHQDPQAQVIVIDPKRSSLVDYVGSPHEGVELKPLLPGVTMANNPNDPEAMWAAIAKARKILDRRAEEAERDRTKKFPVCLVILDELNMFRDISETHWARLRAEDARRDKEERENLPKECPVWDDIRAILRTGRFVACHMLAVAQDFRDDAIGGKGTRNYFGLRGMGGFHPNQWKYFIGTTPVPLSQRGIGRWIFTQGEDQAWVQITYADPEKAYAWASHGRELYAEPVSVQHVDTTLSLSELYPGQTDGQIEGRRTVIGLKQAALVLDMSQSAFEKARQRRPVDGERRVGNQPAWDEQDLIAWRRNAPRAQKSPFDVLTGE
jgi:hypothetical protein